MKGNHNHKGYFNQKYNYITKEFLILEYITNKKSIIQITKEQKCDSSTISNRLNKYNISKRTQIEAVKLAISGVKNRFFHKGTELSGKNNPNWKNGISTNNFCIDCESPISYGNKRCSDCYHKYIKGKKRCPLSLEHKKSISKTKKLNKTHVGKNNPNFGKGCQSKDNNYKGGYYKKIWMRSSWEIKYAKYLDKNKIKWTYEKKVFDLGNCTYRPDFYLIKTNEWIEVKGYWRPGAKRKFKLFKKKYPKVKITVLMGKELRELGILKRRKNEKI